MREDFFVYVGKSGLICCPEHHAELGVWRGDGQNG